MLTGLHVGCSTLLLLMISGGATRLLLFYSLLLIQQLSKYAAQHTLLLRLNLSFCFLLNNLQLSSSFCTSIFQLGLCVA